MPASESLYAQLQALIPLTAEDFAAFAAALQPRQLRKKELLLREGEICQHVAYIESGCLRYFYTVEGEEHTGQFFFEHGWYTDYDSFLRHVPSTQNIQALEPCRLWLLPHADLYRLYAERPVFERFGRLMAEHAFQGLRTRNDALLNLTPEQRYLRLVAERPKVVARVPQHYIASHLGPKPESLSRIRKRLLDNRRLS
ncbi:Crp/Fnr family transcriptional regulator [Hymenobacter elongatus]|uniref:Crp/Fnr family transcriptional regulator n=1 Tax=Hymenobacter elongatus TaxID=877208 RepID=A0A4Z0PGV5_9BACT|nr:Crp/Fnr family transcriptional regulator [Hymenobacter elongatus]TGE14374.1 Crp/Fnr family transcriptional regulator [Hymenobacter elongatus]